MPIVTLRAPLSGLAGGHGQIRVAGTTVGEALRALERAQPGLAGWILDEHGAVRSHVNVFTHGARSGEAAPVAEDDVIHVLAAISGGAR